MSAQYRGLPVRSCVGETRTVPNWDGTERRIAVEGSDHVKTLRADALLCHYGAAYIPPEAATYEDDEEGLTRALVDVLREPAAKGFLSKVPDSAALADIGKKELGRAWSNWLFQRATDTSTLSGPAQRVRDILAAACRKRHAGVHPLEG
jgi:hypothetical protein